MRPWKGKTHNTHLKIPMDLYWKVKETAFSAEHTMTDAIVRGLTLYLKEQERRKNG